MDVVEPERVRPFWRVALGYVEKVTDEGAVDLVDPDHVRPTMWFQRTSQPKTVKNRLHLDIAVPTGGREPLVAELVGVGGTVLAVYPRFTVLADPEGNEVCLTED
jgi:4a-hydroxytetrahydrobiopterin dehydratase